MENNKRGLTLRYEDIQYSVSMGKKKPRKQVLDGITGSVGAGTFMAIMGPTGSGKTSLLNTLAVRLLYTSGSSLSGRVFVDGVARTSEKIRQDFQRRTAYVQQDDNLYPFITVRETLIDAALLTLPSALSKQQKIQRADNLIQQLGLRKCSNTYIGMANGPVRGVSGGERKRVSIAVELLADPDVLFLDEPTSGLDSFQALNVVLKLKELASTGRTVVCSIHQPRSSIYSEFDGLCLLSEGKMVYQGSAGDVAVDYFRSCGHVCPEHYNPADFFMDVCSIDSRSDETESSSQAKLEILWSKYADAGESVVVHSVNQASSMSVDQYLENDQTAPVNVDALEDGLDHTKANANTKPESSQQRQYARKPAGYNTTWLTQFIILLQRCWRSVYRNKFGLIIRLLPNVILSLILVAIYSESGSGQKSIQDKQGLLFFVVLNQSFGGMFGALQTFGKEKTIITRERFSRAYQVSAYYLARFWTGLPGDIAFPSVASVIIYWSLGLNNEFSRFLVFLCAVFFVAFSSQGLGMAISAWFSDFEQAAALAPPILLIMMFFAGFYINSDSLPEGSRWVKYITPHYWGFGILVKNEFEGTVISCYDTPVNQTCTPTGDAVVARLDLTDFDIGNGFLGLLAITLGFHAIAFVSLFMNQPKLKHFDEDVTHKTK